MTSTLTDVDQLDSALLAQVSSVSSKLYKAKAVAGAERLTLASKNVRKLDVNTLYSWINVPLAVNEARSNSKLNVVAQILANLRNVAALLPLIFTWWALSDAAGHYQQQIAANPRLVDQPFLILWQNRFGGQANLSFSGAASIDVCLLGIVLLLTISSLACAWRSKHNITVLNRELNQVIEQLAYVIITEPLAQVGNDPERWADSVRTVIRDAMAKTKDLAEKLAETNQETMRAAVGHLDAMKVATLTLHENLITRIDDMSDRVVSQVTSVLESVQSSNDELRRAAQSELHGMTAATENLCEQLSAQTSETMKHMAAHLAQVFNQTAQDHQAIVSKAIDELEEVNEVTIRTVSDIGDATKVAVTTLGSSVEDLIKGKLAPLILEFKTHVEKLQQSEGRYHTSAAELSNAVSELQGAAIRLASEAGTYSSTAIDIKLLLEQVELVQRNYASELRAYQAQFVPPLTEAVNGMATTAQSVHQIASAIDPTLVTALARTEGHLERVGTNLETASSSLSAVTLDLERKLTPVNAGLEDVQKHLREAAAQLDRAATHLKENSSVLSGQGGRTRGRRMWPFN